MKKILVLCRRDDREEYDRQKNMVKGLREAQSDCEYTGADYEDLIFRYDGSNLTVTNAVSGTDVADYDGIFLIGWFKSKALDDIARAVAHYAHANNVPFANSEAYHGRSFTKLSQCVIAALNGVRVTPFVFSLNPDLLIEEGKKLEMPYIAKAVAASRGRDNYLIKSHDELESAVREVTELPRFFILQEFIPNDGDYRILVMGGKVHRVIHRLAQEGSHVNNTSQGGTATLTDPGELPQKVLDDSLELAKLFRREVTGVDMIRRRDSDEYYFLEANNMPQLATGSYVSEKMQALADFLGEMADNKTDRYID